MNRVRLTAKSSKGLFSFQDSVWYVTRCGQEDLQSILVSSIDFKLPDRAASSRF